MDDKIRQGAILLPEITKAYCGRIKVWMENVTFRLATRRKMWKTKRDGKFHRMIDRFD